MDPSDIFKNIRDHDYRSFAVLLVAGGIAAVAIALYKYNPDTPYGMALGLGLVIVGLIIFFRGPKDDHTKLWTAYYPHTLDEVTKGRIKRELEKILSLAEEFVKKHGINPDSLRANLFFPDPTKSENEKMLCLTIPPGLDIDLNDGEKNFYFGPNEGVTGVCFSNKESVATRAVYKKDANNKNVIDDWLHVANRVKYKSFYLNTKKSSQIASIDWIIAVPLFYEEGGEKYSLGVLNIDCLLPTGNSQPLPETIIILLSETLFQKSTCISKIFQEKKGSCGRLILQRMD